MYDLAFFYVFLMAGYLVIFGQALYECMIITVCIFRYLYILARFIEMKTITLTLSLELCEWEIANQAFLGSQMSRDTSR